MSDGILLTGKRGAGKSLLAVHQIRERMLNGCMVATNLDLDLKKLVPARNRICPFRLPDWPQACDFEALPLGNPTLRWEDGNVILDESYQEAKNGLIVLDELATFLNSRTWNAKDRQDLISWLLQSRKFGWDLLFLAQHPRLIDAQLRDSLFDLVGSVRRLDKIALPFLGRIASLTGVKLKMPRIHVCSLKYGMHPGSPTAELLWCRGSDLFEAYSTTQKIDPAVGVKTGEGYQLLSRWHLDGRYMGWWEMHKGIVFGCLLAGVFIGVVGTRGWSLLTDRASSQLPLKQSASVVEEKFATGVTAKGFFRDSGVVRAVLSDGKLVVVDQFREVSNGWQVRVGDLWYQGGAE